jgi:hypothetical protein
MNYLLWKKKYVRIWYGSSKVENKSSFLPRCGDLPIFAKNVNLSVTYAKYMHVWL